ncbi:UDP-N-acetylmuramoyl-L-alanyl-D-glutamate--2,6-diaminopimelate ligase [Marinilabilia rubra]|uniref:UDP-N-acetylmuramoyl-L-alanyl-D-glutamate--2,6-diaminopimelate ligase n=1 Tax=Marinilabilia rubra TaxID=2162893 RepID=A0A2U2BEG4_9BACT|nr:UDP-N-acetylmuramoyl-L-alanyl-D-glutamate--2,6-diaminopimelate ligase [Marinilabilia rubra]PWE01407.1 UDP-N-acetylmuramoyl-L-alanyl-D-glutamate--2,6-diaminopimelate ligase [Marinilabilia rubra]
MQKRLSECIKGIDYIEKIGNADPFIEDIVFDSRAVGPHSVFVAVRGTHVDGHEFVQDAIADGALAVICEQLPVGNHPNVVFVKVTDSHKAMAQAAANFYDDPSSKLKLVGVTGTNGKTTIATLLYNTARLLGFKAGLCSTLANYINDKKLETTHTTPDVVTLNKLMSEMVDAGCDYCFMEVSSHAVHQGRVEGLDFKGGIFSNISHDHLDYHKTFDEYIRVKKKFFDDLPDDAFALVNADDKHGRVMHQNTKASHKTYSLREVASYRARIVEGLFEGMQLSIEGEEFWTPFVGRFNASNLIAVYGAGRELGWDKKELLVAMSQLKSVGGRFETVRSKSGVTGVVDYAHTPDALKNVLEAINNIRRPEQTLITVVGAGGNRDTAKRPVMAAEAVKNSSKVILTSDNPRDEEPQIIIDQMMEGIQFAERIKVLTILDRREAIRTACTLAQPGDIVLVAGKGHETYQEVKGQRSHFDDREIIREFFDQQ